MQGKKAGDGFHTILDFCKSIGYTENIPKRKKGFP